MPATITKQQKPRRSNPSRTALVLLALMAAPFGLSTSGCRITGDDVHAWARKVEGPRKLLAVVKHDKYETKLRVDAAMTLVTMPTRGGSAVGLVGSDEFVGLLVGLGEMKEDERSVVVDGMVPFLVTGMKQKPAAEEADTSFPYKDAAFALLQNTDTKLVSNKLSQNQLKGALSYWCQQDFVARMDNIEQLYGMELVLKFVGSSGVRGLTGLFTPEFKKTRQLAKLIAELGDEPTKKAASTKLRDLASRVNSQEWLKERTQGVQAANKASGLKVTKNQLEKQLLAYQAEELNRVFSAMRSVGKEPTISYLLKFAGDKDELESQRAAALSALEGHLNQNDPAQAKALLNILSRDDSPDKVRDVAMRRIGELSRARVAKRLYSLFNHDRWQLRWSVASLLLKMSEVSDIDGFMLRLGKIDDMAMTEALSYGQLLGKIEGVDSQALTSKYSDKKYPAPVRLSALGYYYEHGTRNDLAKLESLKFDRQKVPSCKEEAKQCAWQCTVPPSNPKAKPRLESIKTVGNFVEYCLLPAIAGRDNAAADKAKPRAVTGKKKSKN